MSQLTVSVFGSPTVRWNNQPLSFPTRKALALLLYLVIEGDPQPRDTLVSLFWPDSDPVRGRQALRRVIADLKATFSAAQAQLPLHISRPSLALNVTFTLNSDLAAASAAYAALQPYARANPPTNVPEGQAERLRPLIDRALMDYGGDFLGSFTIDTPPFEQWAMTQRSLWQQRMAQLFAWGVQLQTQAGQQARAIDYAIRWVALDPLNGLANHQLIAAYCATGNLTAARAAYAAYAAILKAELDIEPELETQQLVAGLRAAARPPATQARRPAPHAPAAALRRAVPRAPQPIIGRDDELAAARRYLLSHTSPLLTLTGPPGVGKTRLAIAIGAETAEDFPAGVAFVDLTTIHDSALLPTAIAAALGLPEPPDRSIWDALIELLCNQDLLLILDNCEHLPTVAPQIDRLIQHCPTLTVLATSREPLRLEWEQRLIVAPLALPDSAAAEPAVLLNAAAVQLYVRQAQLADPGFALTVHNAPAVAQLCLKLDGLPLAIKLAASRSALLSPAALLQQLEGYLRILHTRNSDVPARHQSLHAAIDASYDLLDKPCQAIFRRLAVFVSGWTLDAAQAVTSADDSAADLLDRLAMLLDHSLIAKGATSETSEPRFRMLETLREYALERLTQAGELEDARRTHAHYFVAWIDQVHGLLRGPQQQTWMERLKRDYPNIRAALQWMSATGDPLMVSTTQALGHFWEFSGAFREGRYWSEQVLAQGNLTAMDRATLLTTYGFLVFRQGDFVQAQELFERALVLYRPLGDPDSIAHTLNNLGMIAAAQADHPRAIALFAESLALWQQIGGEKYLRSQALALNNLGAAAMEQGAYARAQAFHEQALALRQQIGDRRGIAISLQNLGYVSLMQDHHQQARTFLVESLALMRDLTYTRGMVEAIERIAWLMARQQAADQAVRLWGMLDQFRDREGMPLWPSDRQHHDHHLGQARAHIGEAAFHETWLVGRQLTIEQAVAEVLAHPA